MTKRTINRDRTAAALLAALLLAPPVLAADDAKECSGPTCTGACSAPAADAAERERLGELVNRQRDELINLARTLAAEQKRQATLEADLVAAGAAAPPPQIAPAPAAPASATDDENRRLRQLLDIEREENAKLAAKLRTATRVANLVFRSSGGEAEPAAKDDAEARPDNSEWKQPDGNWTQSTSQ